MKNATIIPIGLLVGFLCGWAADSGRGPANAQSKAAAEKAANTETLAGLYPNEIALTVLKDMRALTVLDTNDAVTARRLLKQDLESQLSLLEILSRELELSDFDQSALKDGRAFLEKRKR